MSRGLGDVYKRQEGSVADTVSQLVSGVNTVWMLLAAMLVFFMQPGFALVEAGFTRTKNTANILMKNFVDFIFGSLLYWFVGFGIMFGLGDFFGTPHFMSLLFDSNGLPDPASLPTEGFLVFQTVFCATSATIVIRSARCASIDCKYSAILAERAHRKFPQRSSSHETRN